MPGDRRSSSIGSSTSGQRRNAYDDELNHRRYEHGGGCRSYRDQNQRGNNMNYPHSNVAGRGGPPPHHWGRRPAPDHGFPDRPYSHDRRQNAGAGSMPSFSQQRFYNNSREYPERHQPPQSSRAYVHPRLAGRFVPAFQDTKVQQVRHDGDRHPSPRGYGAATTATTLHQSTEMRSDESFDAKQTMIGTISSGDTAVNITPSGTTPDLTEASSDISLNSHIIIISSSNTTNPTLHTVASRSQNQDVTPIMPPPIVQVVEAAKGCYWDNRPFGDPLIRSDVGVSPESSKREDKLARKRTPNTGDSLSQRNASTQFAKITFGDKKVSKRPMTQIDTELEEGELELEPGEVGLEFGEVGLEPGEVGLEPGEVGLETGEVALEPGEVVSIPEESVFAKPEILVPNLPVLVHTASTAAVSDKQEYSKESSTAFAVEEPLATKPLTVKVPKKTKSFLQDENTLETTQRPSHWDESEDKERRISEEKTSQSQGIFKRSTTSEEGSSLSIKVIENDMKGDQKESSVALAAQESLATKPLTMKVPKKTKNFLQEESLSDTTKRPTIHFDESERNERRISEGKTSQSQGIVKRPIISEEASSRSNKVIENKIKGDQKESSVALAAEESLATKPLTMKVPKKKNSFLQEENSLDIIKRPNIRLDESERNEPRLSEENTSKPQGIEMRPVTSEEGSSFSNKVVENEIRGDKKEDGKMPQKRDKDKARREGETSRMGGSEGAYTSMRPETKKVEASLAEARPNDGKMSTKNPSQSREGNAKRCVTLEEGSRSTQGGNKGDKELLKKLDREKAGEQVKESHFGLIEGMQVKKKLRDASSLLDDVSSSTKPKESAIVQNRTDDPRAEKDCKDISLVSVGSRVSVYWDGEDAYFKGVVARERTGHRKPFFIKYDDGDREWIDLSKIRFRLLNKEKNRKRLMISEEGNEEVKENFVKRAKSNETEPPSVSRVEIKPIKKKEEEKHLVSNDGRVRVQKPSSSSSSVSSIPRQENPSSDLEREHRLLNKEKKRKRLVINEEVSDDEVKDSFVKKSKSKEREPPSASRVEIKSIKKEKLVTNDGRLRVQESSSSKSGTFVPRKENLSSNLESEHRMNTKQVQLVSSSSSTLESVPFKKAKKVEKNSKVVVVGKQTHDRDTAQTKKRSVETKELSRVVPSSNPLRPSYNSDEVVKREKSNKVGLPCLVYNDRSMNMNNSEFSEVDDDSSSEESETDEEEVMQWAVKMFGIRPPPGIARPKSSLPLDDLEPHKSDLPLLPSQSKSVSETFKLKKMNEDSSVEDGMISGKKFKIGKIAAHAARETSMPRTNCEKEGVTENLERKLEEEKDARRKKELARPLTEEEVRAILNEADDDGCLAQDSVHWVRRSVRQPSLSILNSPQVKSLIAKLKSNDPDMVILKMKKYVNDPAAPCLVINAVLDALEENTNCQALYIQNFNEGMRDEQVLHLLKVLQQPSCNIWCLNIGETYKVKRRTWKKFVSGLKKTKITHMYASEHTISAEMKEKIRRFIRDNRMKHNMHIDPENLDVIVRCTHCWWNPINAKVLRPYLKKRGYEHILNDKEGQGLLGSTSE